MIASQVEPVAGCRSQAALAFGFKSAVGSSTISFGSAAGPGAIPWPPVMVLSEYVQHSYAADLLNSGRP